MRTIARETLFKLVFSSQFGEDGIDRTLKSNLYKINKLEESDKEYCERVLGVIAGHSEEFASLLNEYSHSFPESRIFPADKSIMLIALSELLYMDDIPRKVSLNEAANLASKYSSEKSASFISGVLAAISGGEDV